MCLAVGENAVDAVSAVGDLVHGFMNHQSKETGEIFREGGEAYALAGTVLAKGVWVKINAAGRVILADANSEAVGYTVEAVSAAGQIVRIMFTRIRRGA